MMAANIARCSRVSTIDVACRCRRERRTVAPAKHPMNPRLTFSNDMLMAPHRNQSHCQHDLPSLRCKVDSTSADNSRWFGLRLSMRGKPRD